MKRLLPLLLLLASCASHHAAPPVASAPITAPADSAVVVPPRTTLDKVLGRPAATPYVVPAKAITRIGKKSNVYYGPTTVSTVGKKAVAAVGDEATASQVEKAKAPIAFEGDATDNTKAGQRGGAAATAPNATASATTIKPPTPWLKYGLWVVGLGGAYWLLLGGGGTLLLALWRRNKPTDTPTA
jgi:hypothetical protein